MHLCKRSLVVAVAGLTLLAGVSAVEAQFGGRGRGQAQVKQQPKGEPITAGSAIKGTIDAVGPGRIQVSCGANEKWMVQFTPQTVVRVTGTAELEAIGVGTMIRFAASVDKKQGCLKGEVSKLTIFSPSNDMALGATTDVAGGAGDGDAMVIGGTVRAVKGGNKLTVDVPQLSPKLKVGLTESPTIDVNVGYYTLARPGDSIEVTAGMKLAPGYAQAKEAKITLAQPLGGGKKKTKAAKPFAKKPGAGDDAAPGFDLDRKPSPKPKAKEEP